MQTQWAISDAHCLVAKACLIYSFHTQVVIDYQWRSGADYVYYFDHVLSLNGYVSEYGLRHVKTQDKPDCDVDLARLLKTFFGLAAQIRRAPFLDWMIQPGCEGPELLEPSSSPIIPMCQYGFYHLLREEWHTADHFMWQSNLLCLEDLGHSFCVRNPLNEAVKTGPPELCEILIQRGLGLQEPLMTACEEGRIDVVKLLIEKGAEVNYYHFGSLLAKSIEMGHDILTEYLISKGAKLDTTSIQVRGSSHVPRSTRSCYFW